MHIKNHLNGHQKLFSQVFDAMIIHTKYNVNLNVVTLISSSIILNY